MMRRVPWLTWLRHGLVPNWVLLLLTLACFAPGLGGPLVLDDEPQLGPLLQAFAEGPPPLASVLPLVHSDAGPAGRPVAMASFVASLWLHGGTPFGLKLDNLLLHLACGMVLLAWLRVLRRLVQGPSGSRAGNPSGAGHPGLPAGPGARLAASGRAAGGWAASLSPWGITAVWLLHPMQVSTVLYTVQRMTELSTLFMLLGLLAYTEGRQLLAGGRTVAGGLLLAATAMVCLPLAVLSKENGVLLLPLCACLEVTVLRGRGSLHLRRRLAFFYGLTLVLPAVLALTVLQEPLRAWLQPGYAFRSFTLAQRLLTEGRVIGYYGVAWFWPAPALLGFFHDGLRPSAGWFTPLTTAPGVLLVLLLAVLALFMRRRAPLAALGLLLFLVGHALESSVLPLELLFEHRNYFPSVGLTLFCAALPWRGLLPPRLWLRPGLFGSSAARAHLPRLLRWTGPRILTLLLLLGLAGLCASRAFLWGAPDRLYPALLAAEPGSPRLAALFANSYANAGHFSEATAFLAGQASLGASLQRVDIDCLARTPFDEARLAAIAAGRPAYLTPYDVQQLVHLANDALEQRCGLPLAWTAGLFEQLASVPLQKAADQALFAIYRAHLLHALQRTDAALSALGLAQQAQPRAPLPRLLAATWLLDAGRAAQAAPLVRAVCQAAVPVEPEWRDTCRDLLQQLPGTPP